jgi:hypothetical protein
MNGDDFWVYGSGWGHHSTGDNYHPSQSGGAGPRVRNLNTKLVEEIAKNLNRLDVDPGSIAAGLSLLPTPIQQNLMDIIMVYLGAMADRAGRYPDHQMSSAFDQARKMLDSIGYD